MLALIGETNAGQIDVIRHQRPQNFEVITAVCMGWAGQRLLIDMARIAANRRLIFPTQILAIFGGIEPARFVVGPLNREAVEAMNG